MNIGENVKRIREARGMTQMELAKAVGVTGSMITQIERGTKSLTMQLAIQLSDVLSCSVAELAGVGEA